MKKKKDNAEWITAERCEWDMLDFDVEDLSIIDKLVIQDPDEFGHNEEVTEMCLGKCLELKACIEDKKEWAIYISDKSEQFLQKNQQGFLLKQLQEQ